MSETPAALASAVLERLGVISLGEAAEAGDSQKVQDYYSRQFRSLELKDIAYWDEDEIPEEVFEPLVEYLAGKGCGVRAWGKDAALEASGLNDLTLLAAEEPDGSIVLASYF